VESQLYRNSRESRVFDAANLVLLAAAAIATLYPLVYVVVVSLSAAHIPNRFFFLWPEQPGLAAYDLVFRNSLLLRSFLNSVVYAGGAALLSVILTMTTAYPLSIRTFPGRNAVMFFITFTLIFNGGLIPYYFVVKGLGLVNTPWAMIVPGSLSAFNIILARTYLQENIPTELREAATVDGASDWTILLRIVVPLSRPIVAVVALFTGVGVWNAYFPALLFLSDQNLYPVAMILRDIVIGSTLVTNVPPQLATQTSSIAVQAATLVLAMLPIACVYPFLQRFFARGLLIGAIKG
jgi:ABC-type glycerol-3-phosphate transport system permease component